MLRPDLVYRNGIGSIAHLDGGTFKVAGALTKTVPTTRSFACSMLG
jgi:hypothetical protein